MLRYLQWHLLMLALLHLPLHALYLCRQVFADTLHLQMVVCIARPPLTHRCRPLGEPHGYPLLLMP